MDARYSYEKETVVLSLDAQAGDVSVVAEKSTFGKRYERYDGKAISPQPVLLAANLADQSVKRGCFIYITRSPVPGLLSPSQAFILPGGNMAPKAAKTDLEQYQNDIEDFEKQASSKHPPLYDAALLQLKKELEDAIEAFAALVTEALDKLDAAAPAPPAAVSPQAEAPKWDVAKHPAYQHQAHATNAVVEESAHVFKVNEKVQARWKRQYVPGRILSITGSTKDPTFYVSYDGYSETASLKTDDLKPLTVPGNSVASQKRKADDTPAYPAASTPYLSAEASIDPTLAEKAKREPSKVSDGPTRPAKIPKKTKNTKALEAAKSKWQDFSKGKVGKQVKKKESMFKTGEGVNARVGFTNSGHEMRKDAPRTRHVYKPEDREDY
ncbi:hypothetical protein E2P81_ATG05376 [Venturia nashicola]|nr:hypothetical protein E2P81_ATG05376 [Venturia nashicola]